jgi:hypothetical protein
MVFGAFRAEAFLIAFSKGSAGKFVIFIFPP